MSRLGWFVGLLISFSSVGVFADDLQQLSWLSGQWRSEKDGRINEEVWMRPEGSMMLGLNRMVFPSGKGAFEYLRIAPVDGKLSYVASPGGRPGTHFPLKEQTENRAVFENLDHDFPQRISYKRKGDVLEARIEGEVNGNLRAQSWRWERVGGEPKPNDLNDKSSSAVGLRTVVYKVNDLAQAKEWYAKAFQKDPYFDEPFYVGFEIGGYELGLDPNMEGVTHGTNEVAYWAISDCKAAYERWLKLGAKSHSPPQEVGEKLFVAAVADPFGNVIGLIENPHFSLP